MQPLAFLRRAAHRGVGCYKHGPPTEGDSYGGTNVRYYGLLSPSNRRLLNSAREQLGAGRTKTSAEPAQEQQDQQEQSEARLCPECGGELLFVRTLSPVGRHQP